MLAEISNYNDNEVEFKLKEEDISIMYIVQHKLLEMNQVDFAGVYLKHPLIKEYILKIVSKKNDNPIKAINDASISASKYLKSISNSLNETLK